MKDQSFCYVECSNRLTLIHAIADALGLRNRLSFARVNIKVWHVHGPRSKFAMATGGGCDRIIPGELQPNYPTGGRSTDFTVFPLSGMFLRAGVVSAGRGTTNSFGIITGGSWRTECKGAVRPRTSEIGKLSGSRKTVVHP